MSVMIMPHFSVIKNHEISGVLNILPNADKQNWCVCRLSMYPNYLLGFSRASNKKLRESYAAEIRTI